MTSSIIWYLPKGVVVCGCDGDREPGRK